MTSLTPLQWLIFQSEQVFERILLQFPLLIRCPFLLLNQLNLFILFIEFISYLVKCCIAVTFIFVGWERWSWAVLSSRTYLLTQNVFFFYPSFFLFLIPVYEVSTETVSYKDHEHVVDSARWVLKQVAVEQNSKVPVLASHSDNHANRFRSHRYQVKTHENDVEEQYCGALFLLITLLYSK